MAKLTVTTTEHGAFDRTTKTAYTHVVVRRSDRARNVFDRVQSGDERAISHAKSGVYARWVKDRGYAVTWHGSEQAARTAASKPYMWDGSHDVVGVFPVDPT